MLRKKSLCGGILSLLIIFVLCSFVFAQDQEYKDYTIQKGDTLWDITNKELQDPFLWPKVWKENPCIENPDLIYPKQTIRIPLYLMQKEIVLPEKTVAKPVIQPEIPEEMPITIMPAKKIYLIDKNLLIISGYIADKLHSIGTMYDRPGEVDNLTKGDQAYIQTNTTVKKGDKLYIIYPVEEVHHPVTGSYMGVRIAILGTAEVIDETDPKILITNSFVEIPVGSLIDTYYEIEPPLAVDNPRKPEINGYIVTTLRRIYAHGDMDIVFIDKGRNDGVEVGDLLATTLQREHKIFNGVIQIISTRPATSAAIIRKAAKEVQIGDPVTAIKPE